MNVKFIKLSENAIVPCYGRKGDAGLDLFTAEDIRIPSRETKVVPTDIAIQLPQGYEAQVRPRSGISLNGAKGCYHVSLVLTFSPILEEDMIPKEIKEECSPYLRVQLGTIDSNYRGNIGIITYNQEPYEVLIPKGTKLAQLVIAPVVSAELVEVDSLEESERGENGYGSSGNK